MTPRQLALCSFGVIAGAFALVYVSDWLIFQIRNHHPTATMPYESLTRSRILAIPQKSGKTDFQIDAERPTETLSCVHALFPHSGFPPCWRLKPHLNDPIPMAILAPPIRNVFWLPSSSPDPATSSPRR
jgi:hypothetical protein